MTWPTVTVKIAFEQAPFETIDWAAADDVTEYVRDIDTFHGRTSEMTGAEPGTLSLTVDNADGRFTPNRSGSPYYPNVRPMRAVQVTATYSGTTYYLFTGFIRQFPVRFDGPSYSEVPVTAVDALTVLARRNLLAVYTEEVLLDNPTAFYPLTEPSGSATAGNIASTAQPVVTLVSSQYPGGAYEFGADVGVATEETGLKLTAAAGAGSNAAGYALRLRGPASGPAADNPSTGFAVELWTVIPSAGGSNHVLAAQHGQASLNFILYTSPGQTVLEVNAVGGNKTLSTFPVVLNDGKLHHVIFGLEADGRTLRLYIDGVVLASDTYATPVTWAGSPRYFHVGGFVVPADVPDTSSTNGVSKFFLSGTVFGVALYPALPSAARISAHYAAGTTGFVNDAEDVRIGRVLDYARWPATTRALDSGKSALQVARLDGGTALAAVQGPAEWASGVVFADGQGRIVFHNRHRRINAPVQVALNSSAALGVEGDIGLSSDEETIRNDVRGTRTGGTTVRVIDSASMTEYGQGRVDTFEFPLATDNEITDAANYRLQRQKEPRLRCPQVTVDPSTSDALWPHALSRGLSDRVTIDFLPDDATPTSGLDFYIESVRHTVVWTDRGKSWRTTWDLSPADPETYWTLADATLGVLDSTTRLAY